MAMQCQLWMGSVSVCEVLVATLGLQALSIRSLNLHDVASYLPCMAMSRPLIYM